MFKTLYRCPRSVGRHDNGPLHESRLGYLEHLAAQGGCPSHNYGRSGHHLSRRNLDEARRVRPSGT